MSKTTKQAKHSDAFRAAAVGNPIGALATSFLSAFGVDLVTLIKIYTKAVADLDRYILTMAVTSGVQIRANVVFVGRDFGNIREKYPELVIEGDRPQQDIYNFGALHALGHLIYHMSSSDLADRALAKAGSCITGDDTTDNEAGKINKEIAGSWTRADMSAFKDLRAERVGEQFVTELMDGLFGQRDAFVASMAQPRAASVSATAPVPPRTAAPKPPAQSS